MYRSGKNELTGTLVNKPTSHRRGRGIRPSLERGGEENQPKRAKSAEHEQGRQGYRGKRTEKGKPVEKNQGLVAPSSQKKQRGGKNKTPTPRSRNLRRAENQDRRGKGT